MITFPEFASQLVLDSGDRLQVEPFQTAFVDDIESGCPECWLIIPEGNGKTTLLAAFALHHVNSRPYASVPVAASTRDQAMLLYRQAKGFILRSNLEGFVCQDGTRRIKFGDSVIQIFAADAGGGDGIIPTLAIIDEPHRAKSMDLYLTWSGKLGKRAGQLVAISTAGEPGSEFETIREQIRQAADHVERGRCFGRYVSDAVILHEYAVPEDGDHDDFGLVKEANPLSTITAESLRRKRTKPTMTAQHWARFTCNVPTRPINSAINEAEWFERKGPGILEGWPISLGYDAGWKYDPTAFVPYWQDESGKDRRLGVATILDPPPGGVGLELDEVLVALQRIHARNPIRLMVLDTLAQARDVADWAAAELGCEVIERGTSLPAQIEDFQRFMEALRNGWLSHSGDAGLTRHALNAVAKQLPRGDYVFARPIASRLAKHQDLRRVDALVSAAMVHSLVGGGAGSVYDERGILAV